MSDEPKSSFSPSNAEPKATNSTVPVWIFSLTLLLVFVGGIYYDHYSGWFDSQVYSPYQSADELELYQPKSGAAAVLARGKTVFEQVCGICHGVDGLGKPGQAPPLAGSEWVNAKGVNRLTHIPLAGLTGPVKVKGQTMDFPSGMVAVGASLSDDDLAAVLTYIRNSWGNKAGEVTPGEVKTVRASIKSSRPMTEDELMKMPE